MDQVDDECILSEKYERSSDAILWKVEVSEPIFFPHHMKESVSDETYSEPWEEQIVGF